MNSRILTPAFLAFALALACTGPSPAMAADSGRTCEHLASRTARTAPEHAMLASYFRQKAAELREQASREGSQLLGSKSPSAAALRAQAGSKSRRERMIADEYERMADEHEAEATAAS